MDVGKGFLHDSENVAGQKKAGRVDKLADSVDVVDRALEQRRRRRSAR